MRWSWDDGSLAIWDNRTVQHYGVSDPQFERYLERVTVQGLPAMGLGDVDRPLQAL